MTASRKNFSRLALAFVDSEFQNFTADDKWLIQIRFRVLFLQRVARGANDVFVLETFLLLSISRVKLNERLISSVAAPLESILSQKIWM